MNVEMLVRRKIAWFETDNIAGTTSRVVGGVIEADVDPATKIARVLVLVDRGDPASGPIEQREFSVDPDNRGPLQNLVVVV